MECKFYEIINFRYLKIVRNITIDSTKILKKGLIVINFEETNEITDKSLF